MAGPWLMAEEDIDCFSGFEAPKGVEDLHGNRAISKPGWRSKEAAREEH